MVLHSTVETRVGLLKDDFVQMDLQHRKQEQRIENMVKDKEAEVCMVLSSPDKPSKLLSFILRLHEFSGKCWYEKLLTWETSQI